MPDHQLKLARVTVTISLFVVGALLSLATEAISIGIDPPGGTEVLAWFAFGFLLVHLSAYRKAAQLSLQDLPDLPWTDFRFLYGAAMFALGVSMLVTFILD